MQKQSFNLDKNFYSGDILARAKNDFSDFTLSIHGDILEIEDENPQNIFDEFSNYCIALSNELSL